MAECKQEIKGQSLAHVSITQRRWVLELQCHRKDKTLLSLHFVNSNQTHVHCKNPLTLEVFFLTPHFFTLPSALSFATPVWYLYIPVRKTCLQVTLHMVNCKTLHTHHPQHTFWGRSCQLGQTDRQTDILAQKKKGITLVK